MIKGKYKRIVAYGCSFTAGDELGDATGLGMPEDEVDALKRSGLSRGQLYGSGTVEHRCAEIGRKLSWPRWLSEKYSVPYSNRAMAGGSVQQMVFRIERDYRTGLINDDDLVLVGITSMFRWFQFNHSGKELTWVFGHPISNINNYNNVLIQNYVNDYNILWTYYLHLNYLEMLSKEKPNIKLFHALTPFSRERSFLIEDENLESSFRETIDSFKFTCFLNFDHGLAEVYSHLPPEQVTHGYGHPKVKIQQEFANLLYAWIEEKVE